MSQFHARYGEFTGQSLMNQGWERGTANDAADSTNTSQAGTFSVRQAVWNR